MKIKIAGHGGHITQERLAELFEYAGGGLVWKVSLNGRAPAGARAGWVGRDGYRQLEVERRRYQEHRLIYLLHHGLPLPSEIDHVNGDPTDNRIENLRACTHSKNLCNAKTRRDNTSGVKGVSWSKKCGKWRVDICLRGLQISCGVFDNIEDAKAAIKTAREKHHGEFARHA